MFQWALNSLFGRTELKSPLIQEQRQWIKQRFDWLRTEFGEDRLRSNVILPTTAFFPGDYTATREGAEVLFERVCRYMDVERSRLDLNLFTSEFNYRETTVPAGLQTLHKSSLGVYEEVDGKIRIWLDQTRLPEPNSLISTIAHELGHVRLLSEGRYSKEVLDHEPLTDLLAVYFGFGIFMANESLREVSWTGGLMSGWSIGTQGYLTMAEYAYALAVYARARGEQTPEWTRYLRPDVLALFKLEMGHLIAGTIPPAMAKPVEASVVIDQKYEEASPLGDTRGDAAPSIPDPSERVVVGEELEVYFDHDTDTTDVVNDDLTCHFSDIDAYFTRGALAQSSGRHEEAVDAFSRVLQHTPNDAEACQLRGESYCSLGRYPEAIIDCCRALSLDPTNAPSLSIRAEACIRLKRYDEALRDTNNAIKGFKRDTVPSRLAHAFQLRALAQIGLGQFKRAIDDLMAAIQLAPTHAGNYLALSRIYEQLGDSKRAQAELATAIRHDPLLIDSVARESLLTGRPLSDY